MRTRMMLLRVLTPFLRILRVIFLSRPYCQRKRRRDRRKPATIHAARIASSTA
jgi:hypothetical protein